MVHEKSITVERDGKHFLLDSVGSNKGQNLGPKGGFKTEKEAKKFAEKRSRSFDKRPRGGLSPSRPKRSVKHRGKTFKMR